MLTENELREWVRDFHARTGVSPFIVFNSGAPGPRRSEAYGIWLALRELQSS